MYISIDKVTITLKLSVNFKLQLLYLISF